MRQILTRRRFGQLAVASTAAAGLSYFATKTVAQTPNFDIIGVGRGNILDNPKANNNTLDNLVADLNNSIEEAVGNIKTQLQVQSLNLATGLVEILAGLKNEKLDDDDRLTGLTYLADGRLIVAITPVSSGSNGGAPTRLRFLDVPSRTVALTDLQKQEALESPLLLKDGSLIGLVANKNGSPPVRIVDINPQNGKTTFTNRVNLPSDLPFTNLAQCPDGLLYSTVATQKGNGETELWRLDLATKTASFVVKLTINGEQWNNGLQSLVCTPAGELLALGALRYKTRNSLYTIDIKTGAMTLRRDFPVAKIAVRPI